MVKRLGVFICTIGMTFAWLSAPAQAATGAQSFRIIFTGDPRAGSLGRVIATGVVTAVGTDATIAQDPHPDGSETDTDRITLPGGTITILDTDPPGTARFNPATCTATLSASGAPYTIIAGTGAYAGAQGGGTFSARGLVVFGRTAGGCSEEIRRFFADVRLTGSIAVP